MVMEGSSSTLNPPLERMGISSSKVSKTRRLVTGCVLPAVAGGALAALALMCVASGVGLFEGTGSVLSDTTSGDRTFEQLAGAAAAHAAGAGQAATMASDLRMESVAAKHRAAELQGELHGLLNREQDRDHQAKRIEAHAHKVRDLTLTPPPLTKLVRLFPGPPIW